VTLKARKLRALHAAQRYDIEKGGVTHWPVVNFQMACTTQVDVSVCATR
jgi:hypothetical protein